MAHKHSVYDTDAHFRIDPITRAIKNETPKKITLIQFDHNSERFSFDMPRYVDGHDMMMCNLVEVHFTNTDTKTGEANSDFYEVKDMQISPDDNNVIVFSWLIDERATQYAGTLEFLIKFKCMTGSVCDYRWNTANNNEISISSGKDNSGTVVEMTPNVVDQWREEIFGNAANAVVNINIAEQEAIKAVQEAGENIVETAAIAEQNAKNVLANAIKGHLKGEVVTADDVSGVEHEMAVKVICPDGIDPATVNVRRCGKNLISPPYAHSSGYSSNGVTFTVQEDKSVIINGTPTGTTEFLFERALKLPIGTYSYRLFGVEKAPEMLSGVVNQYNSETWLRGLGSDRGNGVSFEVTEADKEYVVRLNVYILNSNKTFENFRVYPILCVGNVADSYEQYKGTDHTPASDGTVSGMMSTAPNMTILTDTEGVVIDCEYIVDTKTYIDKKFEEFKTAILAEE